MALHARQVVPEWSGGRQHPILDYEQADNFAIAYYAGGDTRVKHAFFTGPPVVHVAAPSEGPGESRTAHNLLNYDAGAVRRFVVEALLDGELEEVCLDEEPLRPALNLLATGMGKRDKTRLVVDWCNRQELLPTLVSAVREHNPAAYRRQRDDMIR